MFTTLYMYVETGLSCFVLSCSFFYQFPLLEWRMPVNLICFQWAHIYYYTSHYFFSKCDCFKDFEERQPIFSFYAVFVCPSHLLTAATCLKRLKIKVAVTSLTSSPCELICLICVEGTVRLDFYFWGQRSRSQFPHVHTILVVKVIPKKCLEGL